MTPGLFSSPTYGLHRNTQCPPLTSRTESLGPVEIQRSTCQETLTGHRRWKRGIGVGTVRRYIHNRGKRWCQTWADRRVPTRMTQKPGSQNPSHRGLQDQKDDFEQGTSGVRKNSTPSKFLDFRTSPILNQTLRNLERYPLIRQSLSCPFL